MTSDHRRHSRAAFGGLGLYIGGCGTVGLSPDVADSAGGGSDTSVLPALRIEEMNPDWAPLAGGTEVTVVGAGFEDDVAFWFGGSEMALTRIDDTMLIVITPEVPLEAVVDVTVESGLDSFTLDDGFRFTDTAPEEEDPEGSDGGGGEPTGLHGGIVEFDYIVVGCPACFGFTEYLSVEATGFFHEGTVESWTDWLPPNGQCVSNPDRSGPTSEFLDVGEHVYLESGTAVSLDLRRSQQGDELSYQTVGLAQADYIKNASYDLVLPETASETSDLVLTTSGFDTITPTDILNDAASAFPPFSASNARFTWSPTGVARSFLVNFQIFDSTGAALLGDVVCAGDDNGSLLVPSSYLSGFPTGSLMAIYFYRWNENEEVDPVTGHTMTGASAFGGLGTGTLRP